MPSHIATSSWWRDEVTVPSPLSPMDLCVRLRNNPLSRRAFSEFGLLFDGFELKEIEGWLYLRLVPLLNLPKWFPAWLTVLFAHLMPRIRSRIQRCVFAVKTDKHWRYVNHWQDELMPE